MVKTKILNKKIVAFLQQGFMARGFIFIHVILFILIISYVDVKANKRPNILFAIADDASWQHFGAYGCNWVQTPAMDKVANEGILFTRAYTPNAKCSPSRACILTGLNSWQLKGGALHVNYFPPMFSSYVEVLKDNGYFVGYTGKGWLPGVAINEEGSLRELTGKHYNELRCETPTKWIYNIDYAANFEAFLNEREGDRPFCFWYGSREPHRNFEFGSGVSKGGKSIAQIEKVPDFWPDVDTIRQDLLDYAFEIEYFDLHLQKMIRLLERKGELDNTIIVVTSDNGMGFPRAKGQVYEYSNHLPLAIMWPNGINKPGRVVSDYVSFIDFAPTFLELANVDLKKSSMHKMEGRSLVEIFNSDKEGQVINERDFILVGKERHDPGRPGDVGYPVRGIFKNKWLYLRNYNPERWPVGNPEAGYLNCDEGATKTYILDQRRLYGKWKYWEINFGKRSHEELYNIEEDPYCLNNLILKQEHEVTLKKLKRELHKKLKEQGDPRILGKEDIFESYPWANRSNENMYDRIIAGEYVKPVWFHPSDIEPEWLIDSLLIEYAKKNR